jgi:hypothetical protein
MKPNRNIHVLPTDKPSRLCKNNNEFYYIIDGIFNLGREKYNIYITSDEEIKEGDWCLLDHNVGQSTGYSVLKCLNADIENGEYLFQDKDGDKFTTGRCDKIILTTDQDLIKDGVQAIPDEFFGWFVKNLSCEFIEVKSFCKHGDNCPSQGAYDKQYLCDIGYKIIIPKEEPKQEPLEEHYLSIPKPLVDVSRMKIDNHPDINKQETLEEAAERFRSNNPGTMQGGNNTKILNAFIAGAKWQAERMYSEEEVIAIITHFEDEKPLKLKEWFEQFKKK